MTVTERYLGLALLVITAVLIYLLEPILMPFLVAVLLAYLGDPVADRLEAAGLSRTVSVVVVFVSLTVLATLLLLVSVPLIGRQLDLLMSKIPAWLDTAQQTWLPWLQQRLGLPADSLPAAQFTSAMEGHWAGAGKLLTTIWAKVAGSSLALVGWLANLLLIPVVTFYLLRDWDKLVARLHDMLPRAWEPRVVIVAKECDEILGAFIRGQLLVMLALAILYSLGLWIVGLDLALILGLLAGLASVVPYLGFIVGIVAAGLAAFFQFHEWLPLMWVAVVFGIGQMVESMLLTPMLVGDRIGLHPVAVIFAVMAGGQLAGFSGVLLALPVAAVVMVWLRHLHEGYKRSSLYGPVVTPDELAADDGEQPAPDDQPAQP